MKTQNLIKRTLSQNKGLLYPGNLIKNEDFSNREELAEYVCKKYYFYDTCGNEQLAGCLKALRG